MKKMEKIFKGFIIAGSVNYEKDGGKDYDISEIDSATASEMFEQAHFLYGTQSIEETVDVLKKIGLEEIANKALGS